MKNEKGITLIVVIITIMLLTIISGLAIYDGVQTYKESQAVYFETYMKQIQKQTDIIIEEETEYSQLGQALNAEQKATLQTIITNNPSIKTRSVENSGLRYFSSNDIKEIFNISDVNDEIVINFTNRDVISLNGVEKNGTMHYVEYTLK